MVDDISAGDVIDVDDSNCVDGDLIGNFNVNNDDGSSSSHSNDDPGGNDDNEITCPVFRLYTICIIMGHHVLNCNCGCGGCVNPILDAFDVSFDDTSVL